MGSFAAHRAGLFVLVGGFPASGKTTLATALASELRLPLLAKDAIKEVLADQLCVPTTVEESQGLGQTAVRVMLRVAQSCPRGRPRQHLVRLHRAPTVHVARRADRDPLRGPARCGPRPLPGADRSAPHRAPRPTSAPIANCGGNRPGPWAPGPHSSSTPPGRSTPRKSPHKSGAPPIRAAQAETEFPGTDS